MDNLDLTNMLDDGNGPDATPEVLGRIVARQRQRQARRYRVAATTAMVVVLGSAGIGLRLDQHGGTTSATGPTSSLPAGLKWVVGADGERVAQSAGLAQPGQFGFSTSSEVPSAATSNSESGTAYGTSQASGRYVAAPIASGGKGSTPKSCAAKECDVVFSWGEPHTLFTRHLDGLSISVSLANYDYPSAIAVGPINVPPNLPVTLPIVSSPAPGSSSPSTETPQAPAPGRALKPTRDITSKSAIPVTTTCPVESELVVTVSYGSVTRTLFVPTGGTSDHPFSLVASAGTDLGGAGSVVIAVAHTSPSVASVSATFPGGGSDAIAPKDGWAVLAQRLPAGTGLSRVGTVDIEASTASGKVLESTHLPATGSLAAAPLLSVCHFLLVPVGVVSPPVGVQPGGPVIPPSGVSGSSGGSSGSSGSSSVTGSKPSS
jgi:hypothetical protein